MTQMDLPQPREKYVSLRMLSKLSSYLTASPIVALGAALCIVFSVSTDHFLSAYNLSNILYQSSLVGILALGLTPLIISGNLDLSVGAIPGLAACLVVGLESHGLPFAVTAALLAGVMVGLVNGFVVERLGVNSLIATLAAMVGVKGLAFLYAGEVSLSATNDSLLSFGNLRIGSIHVLVVVFIVLALLFHLMLTTTIQGRNSYAVGGSRIAAVDAGIPVGQTVVFNFVLCGLMAALCGVAMAANLGAATPTFGKDYELWAITAVVIGGSSLKGGAGSVVGSFAAALTLAILRNGLNMLHVPPFYIPILVGSVLILALLFDKRLGTTKIMQGE